MWVHTFRPTRQCGRPGSGPDPSGERHGQQRPNGYVIELTRLVGHERCPPVALLICRRERPHPGAQPPCSTPRAGGGTPVPSPAPRSTDLAALELCHGGRCPSPVPEELRVRQPRLRGPHPQPSSVHHLAAGRLPACLDPIPLPRWAIWPKPNPRPFIAGSRNLSVKLRLVSRAGTPAYRGGLRLLGRRSRDDWNSS